MAIIKKFDPKKIYITEKLSNRLSSLFDNSLTIIEAPTGFGKTTAVRYVLKEAEHPYIWFNIESSDQEQFIKDFSARISSISETAAHKIRTIGYPLDVRSSRSIARVLFDIEFREKTILVLDNYQLIADTHMDRVISDLTTKLNKNLVVIVLTQAIKTGVTFDLVLKKELNYIGKTEFELSKNDIIEYYKLCGIKLDDEEAISLYTYTEGWISALYLQMLSYKLTNTFEPNDSIENLVSKAIWNNLKRNEQDFLISISVFDSFTLRQAVNMYGNKLSEDKIEKVINDSGLIRYDSKEGKYYMHSLLKYFLSSEFEKIEPVFKKEIYKNAGDWFKANEKYYTAIEYYYKIKDYEAILSMEYGASEFGPYIKKDKKEMFVDIVSKTSFDIKNKYKLRYIIFVYYLFIFNERDMLENECEGLSELIKADITLLKREKEILLGNLEFVKALTVFNHFDKMIESYKKSFQLLKSPSTLFSSIGSWTFNCPSVLSTYHRSVGKLKEEVKIIDKGMPTYYKVTDGNGKGGEALMRAEMLLFQGDYADAEILCQKSMYMANTRNQTSVYLSAMMNLARIYCIKGEASNFFETIKELNQKIEDTKRYDLVIMSDLCNGMIYSILEDLEKIPSWLFESESVENNCTTLTLGYANIIYGKVLLIREDYTKLLGVSGQFIGVSNIFSNIIYKIYTYIYITIAHLNTRQYDKTTIILQDAIDLAMPDMLILPFAENYEGLSCELDKIAKNPIYSDFVKKIKVFSKTYTKGFKSIIKVLKNDQNYGLTNRELEVAKLAAERMTNKEIADMLFIAESTVKSNLKIVFNKLSINSRAELKEFF